MFQRQFKTAGVVAAASAVEAVFVAPAGQFQKQEFQDGLFLQLLFIIRKLVQMALFDFCKFGFHVYAVRLILQLYGSKSNGGP